MVKVKRIIKFLGSKLRPVATAIVDLYALAKEGRLPWLIYFVWHRARWWLLALYSGVRMNRSGQGTLYNSRRNIHRIEKGLLYAPPKAVFAEDYILETVSDLAELKSSGDCDSSTLAWSEAVLDKYFKTCEHTKKVEEAHRLYQKLEPKNVQPAWCPYPAKDRPDLVVEYEALYQLALRRSNVRYYLDKTVEFGLVEKAMRVAALSPSACNRQSFKFLFYNDKDIVRRISQLPGGMTGYEVPSIVVVLGSYRGYFDERDALVPIIDASLAVMSFLFALETLGLSTVCINSPSLPDKEKRIRELIHLEQDDFIVMMIGVGYPDPEGKIPYSAKRDISELIYFGSPPVECCWPWPSNELPG